MKRSIDLLRQVDLLRFSIKHVSSFHLYYLKVVEIKYICLLSLQLKGQLY